MKKIVVWTLVLALTLSLGAVALADGSLDAILAKGTFILGLDDSFPPMGYRNEDNEIVGVDIDLATEVCARLGVELKLQPIEWSMKENELNAGNIDCIWNGMSRTPDREVSMALSIDYLNNSIVLLGNNPDYQTMEDLVGKVIAVQTASAAEDAMNDEDLAEYRASLKEVRGYTDYLMAVMDLQNGNLDAVAIDASAAAYCMANLEDDSLFVIGDLAPDLFCIGFRKDDIALRDAVNELLIEMAKDGTLDAVFGNWFESYDSLVPAE